MSSGTREAIWLGLESFATVVGGVFILTLFFVYVYIPVVKFVTTHGRRFSLRTLLIVTTAIAVILGLVVYATR